MQSPTPNFLLLAIGFGLVCLAIGLTRHLLRRTSVPVGLAFFLSLAAVCCVGYVVVLFYGIRHVRYEVSDADPGVTPEISNETRLIELHPPDTSADKPTWVDAKPTLVGDRYEISVASDPKLTAAEAQADLSEKVAAATRTYIRDLLHEEASRVQVSREFIAEHIQRDTFLEPVRLTVGDMQIAHALLVFDNPIRDEFRQQQRAGQMQDRMVRAGGLAALVLTLLGTIFGFLKIDTLTRGYYTGRLQLAAGTLILGVVLAGLLLAKA